MWGAPWEENSWFFRTDKNSPAVAALVRDHHDMFEFQRWLQWIADEQVAAAQQAAKDSGMALGLMQDMAVGVHALGADVWWSPERFADGVTVGAPPDFYNQLGQDWGQPPFSPQYLESTGYRVYREMVHNMFAHAGALRIDHMLGLFRLWWIPRGCTARDGAYVTYNHEVMLSILAIEASRANGVVIGEDLGTVPEYVSKVLAEHGVLGTAVEWFSRVDNSPNAGDPYAPPEDYRKYALASVTTHDLPPTAGYLKLEHVDLREELDLLNEPARAVPRRGAGRDRSDAGAAGFTRISAAGGGRRVEGRLCAGRRRCRDGRPRGADPARGGGHACHAAGRAERAGAGRVGGWRGRASYAEPARYELGIPELAHPAGR